MMGFPRFWFVTRVQLNRLCGIQDATAGGRFVPEGITSSQHSGVDMNINNVVIFYKFPVYKTLNFSKN